MSFLFGMVFYGEGFESRLFAAWLFRRKANPSHSANKKHSKWMLLVYILYRINPC